MADSETRNETQRDEPRRESGVVVNRSEGAADRRLGRQAFRAADAERRIDGDPARIEAGAATPMPERLSTGESVEERNKRQQANTAAGLDRDRIAEGALTPMTEADPDKAREDREKAVRLAEENKKAGLEPSRIEAGAVTPMPPLPGGMTTTHPDAAMGKGD